MPSPLAIGAVVLTLAGCLVATWSYVRGGVVYALISVAWDADTSLDVIRDAVARAGVFAPVVYVGAVVIEVLVAPIPGAMLYAPGGAIFGGWWGGTLSLIGNVIGAAIASWLGAAFGARLPFAGDGTTFNRLAERLRRRGVWIVALLRINPLTSSDLVSYAAGVVQVPVWRVAAGTLIGMAPLCYAQSFASEQIFRLLPASGLAVLLLGVLYLCVVVWIVTRAIGKPTT